MRLETAPADVLARLDALREHDAPTHGGRVLTYVYDAGLPELDALVEEAARRCLHLNGLDPIVFGSIGAMEREVVGFVRDLLHGGATGGADDVVGTVTSGGTESILLAALSARELHPERSRLLAPTTRHPAWRKAAHLLGLELETVPVDADGVVHATAFAERLGADVALAIVSAPSYPHAALDPVGEIGAACLDAGVDLHVDACIGGLALPFWPDVPAWDLRVPGVTSISADLHKYAYAPKGASVLLQRGRRRRTAHYFADTDWPGYPVVTSTLLGSRQPAGLAGAWAAITALGIAGLQSLMDSCRSSVARIVRTVEAIEGLRVLGQPVGPLLALAADPDSPTPVDPYALIEGLAHAGFHAQAQPGLRQDGAPDLPPTAHLTVTPALEQHVDALCAALETAAQPARDGRRPSGLVAALGALEDTADIDADALLARLSAASGAVDAAGFADLGAELFDLVERLPHAVSERLMIEVVSRHLDPR